MNTLTATAAAFTVAAPLLVAGPAHAIEYHTTTRKCGADVKVWPNPPYFTVKIRWRETASAVRVTDIDVEGVGTVRMMTGYTSRAVIYRYTSGGTYWSAREYERHDAYVTVHDLDPRDGWIRKSSTPYVITRITAHVRLHPDVACAIRLRLR